jgi:hypothetical protein
LANNTDIIIKPADKGNATVVQNRIDYLREGYRQLSDEEAYKALNKDPTELYRREIVNMVEDMYQSGELDERVKQYLMDPVCKASRFYLLPKIHKGTIPTPGRPVVSGNGCPTEKISSFVDHFLNPTTQLIKSYVKDTTHFLQLMNGLGDIPQGALLVTLDVVGLYPNIPNAQGLEAARVALEKSRPDPNVRPSNRSLMKLLNVVLTRNNFVFNGKHYLQIRGTAIGTKVAVGFANNFMGFFERLFVYIFDKQPLVWLRFIDDIFMIWTHGEESLKEFVTYLNSCVDSINFTTESSENTVNFLDMKVKIRDQRIQTDLYSKPTDSHSYLLYNSAHPQRCKDSIPYSQFLRVRRICSLESDYKDHILVLTCHFMRRGYPMKLLSEAAKIVQSLDREELLEMTARGNEKTGDDKVFLITTYNPNYQQLRHIVHGNWEMLGKSPATDFLYERRLMCGYRRPKNLRDILIRANTPHKDGDERAENKDADPEDVQQSNSGEVLPTEQEATVIGPLRQKSILDYLAPVERVIVLKDRDIPAPLGNQTGAAGSQKSRTKSNLTPKAMRGFNFCNQNSCRYCPNLNKSGSIQSTVTGKVHTAMTNISCRSSNLIYCITCRRCKKQYVGQTSLRIKSRFVHHYYTVDKEDKSKPVGKHFSQLGHDGISDMEIHVLEFIKVPPKSEAARVIRNRVERRWIHLLRTPAPKGLNIDDL